MFWCAVQFCVDCRLCVTQVNCNDGILQKGFKSSFGSVGVLMDVASSLRGFCIYAVIRASEGQNFSS